MSRYCDNQGCANQGVLQCANCKISYYCSKGCQSLDWKTRHKRHCNKIDKGLCFQCHMEPGLKKCAGCNVVRYCSAACQKKDWNFHKKRCDKHATGDVKSKALLMKCHPELLLCAIRIYFTDNGLKFADYKGCTVRIVIEEEGDRPSSFMITPLSEKNIMEMLRPQICDMEPSGVDCHEEIMSDPNIFILLPIYNNISRTIAIDRTSYML